MDRSTPGRAVLLFLTTFTLLLVILPLLYPYGSFTHLDGKAGVIDNWAALSFADPLTRAVYFLGDLFCHQEWARSFILNGSQLAFCQRDVSILAGAVAGLIVTDKAVSLIDTGDKRLLVAGAVMIVSTFIEWGVEYLSGWDILAGRTITGLMAGAGIALIFQYGVTREYEKIVFGKGV